MNAMLKRLQEIADSKRVAIVPPIKKTMTDVLLARGASLPNQLSDGRFVFSRMAGPRKTTEFLRIKNLPTKTLEETDLAESLRVPGGTLKLWPVQLQALLEAQKSKGLLGCIAVGYGKTIISVLLPTVLRAKRPLLLVPAQVKSQLIAHDLPRIKQHFRVHSSLTIASYEELSRAKGTSFLESLEPDVIIADEVHKLRYRDTARTRRFLRYMQAHPETLFCGLSGTILGKSLEDYGHLAELALRESTPLPRSRKELLEWAAALDPKHRSPMPPGVLVELCEKPKPSIIEVREAFRDRQKSVLGFVATAGASVSCSLILNAMVVEVPASVRNLLSKVDDCDVEGNALEDALAVARVKRQLSQGFYYRWAWPDGIVNQAWLDARNEWHKAVRQFLLRRSIAGLDSPMLIANAATRKAPRVPKAVIDAWNGWRIPKETEPPPVEPVWIDEFLIDAAMKWHGENESGIIWYEHRAIGEKLRARGITVFDAGPEQSATLVELAQSGKTPVIACSIKAHGTGKNLQAWAKALMLCPPPGGTIFEQTLGRLHRAGQEADEVVFDLCTHTEDLKEAIEKATAEARFVEQTTGQRQKLLYATRT